MVDKSFVYLLKNEVEVNFLICNKKTLCPEGRGCYLASDVVWMTTLSGLPNIQMVPSHLPESLCGIGTLALIEHLCSTCRVAEVSSGRSLHLSG